MIQHSTVESIEKIFEEAQEELTPINKQEELTYTDHNDNVLIQLQKIRRQMNQFNYTVKFFNKKLSEKMKFYPNLPFLKQINKKSLLPQLNKRFLVKYKNKESQRLANEVLDLKIISSLNESFNSILEFEKFFKNLSEADNIKMREKYADGFLEAKAILSIGCAETAIFVAGRTIESLINDLLIKKSIIQKIDLKNIKLEGKIGKLMANKVINEKEFHVLQKLKFDRNDFGHPFDKKISFNEAKGIIFEASSLATILEKKLK